MPFGIEKKTVAFYREEAVDKETVIKSACMDYSNLVYDKYKNSNIVSGNARIKSEKNRVVISGEYQCIDFIGESKPIIIENIEN